MKKESLLSIAEGNAVIITVAVPVYDGNETIIDVLNVGMSAR